MTSIHTPGSGEQGGAVLATDVDPITRFVSDPRAKRQLREGTASYTIEDPGRDLADELLATVDPEDVYTAGDEDGMNVAVGVDSESGQRIVVHGLGDRVIRATVSTSVVPHQQQ